MTMPQIAARFTCEYPSFSLDVDLTLPGRGVTALFGPSGSGKTTLLRCIAGLEVPAKGFLSVAGDIWQSADHCLPTHQRPLGYVFQQANLFTHLTVAGNLDYARKRAGRRQPAASLDQAIALLDIAPLLARKPARLSGGEQQRVAIARALASNPRLLLMDEPLAALDQARKRDILPYLERLHDELEIPLLYVSHAADEVARLADHLVVLADGRVRAAGPLSETLARLDLPLQLGDDLGVVIHASVVSLDTHWHLAQLAFDGGSLWVADPQIPPGRQVRVRILAKDVSLTLEKPENTSIQNLLPGEIDAISEDTQQASALLRIKVGQQILLARLTRRAVASLGLTQGQPIWAQVKAVALME